MLANSITSHYTSMNLHALPDADAQLFSFLASIEEKKEVDNADIEQFSRLLQDVDLDGYMEDEDLGILRSALILVLAVNSDIKNGELLIDAVLARHPNLDLPILTFPNRIPNSSDPDPDAPFPSFANFLRQMREEVPSSTSTDGISYERIDRILDYVDKK